MSKRYRNPSIKSFPSPYLNWLILIFESLKLQLIYCCYRTESAASITRLLSPYELLSLLCKCRVVSLFTSHQHQRRIGSTARQSHLNLNKLCANTICDGRISLLVRIFPAIVKQDQVPPMQTRLVRPHYFRLRRRLSNRVFSCAISSYSGTFSNQSTLCEHNVSIWV